MPIQSPSSKERPNRIYLNPPKFWAATKGMTDGDLEQFANKIFRLAEERRIEELEQYDFISFEWRRAS